MPRRTRTGGSGSSSRAKRSPARATDGQQSLVACGGDRGQSPRVEGSGPGSRRPCAVRPRLQVRNLAQLDTATDCSTTGECLVCGRHDVGNRRSGRRARSNTVPWSRRETGGPAGRAGPGTVVDVRDLDRQTRGSTYRDGDVVPSCWRATATRPLSALTLAVERWGSAWEGGQAAEEDHGDLLGQVPEAVLVELAIGYNSGHGRYAPTCGRQGPVLRDRRPR